MTITDRTPTIRHGVDIATLGPAYLRGVPSRVWRAALASRRAGHAHRLEVRLGARGSGCK